MKILFLDVDGVLNSENTFRKHPNAHFPIDPYMVLLLDRIVHATGCRVVLSSSWRHHAESVEHIKKHICPILDITPTLNGVRGEEIREWMMRWQDGFHPEYEIITKFAIVDDDSDFLPGQPLFKTSWKEGLTDEIAQKIISHLNS